MHSDTSEEILSLGKCLVVEEQISQSSCPHGDNSWEGKLKSVYDIMQLRDKIIDRPTLLFIGCQKRRKQ
jgi:hypothetical protein